MQHVGSLFAGNTLGVESDIADGSLRKYEVRSLANIVGDYYIAPSFLDAVVVRPSSGSMKFLVLAAVCVCVVGPLHRTGHTHA